MEKAISKKMYFAVYLEIILMISITVSMSYLLAQTNYQDIIFIEQKQNTQESTFLKYLAIFNKIFWNENNLVSASSTTDGVINTIDDLIYSYNGTASTNAEITALDFTSGIHTCPKDNNGRYCQEYPASSCNANCNVSCVPTPASQSAVCKVGTCYDSTEGSCAVGSTRQNCEDSNGLWFNDPLGNLEVCKAGCCVLGENAFFITDKQCAKESAARGIASIFKPEIKTEIACLALSKEQEEGACVIEDPLGNSCRFTTKTNCALNLKGKFYSGLLCSNPDFNTKCVRQKTIQCAEGKDELYWFDSCGNRENIYSVNKEQSYNMGKILSKQNSCQLDITNKNSQATCGNCNVFAGSMCGTRTAQERLSESNAEFVCKDLSCTDSQGNKRNHGESWCDYQGSVDLDKGVFSNRSTNPVGSRSFKSTCYEGEIITDPCADYDNEICTQASVKTNDGRDFSTAACRINRAYECYQYNKAETKNQCTKNPDCSIKSVSITESFKFDLCTPKHTPGFDLEERGEGAATICSFASQKCQVVNVKKLSGWKCVANCECANVQKFAEQMNDVCISLGDCGTKANYLGDLTVNHGVYKSRSSDGLGSPVGGQFAGLSNNYINKLTSYANEKTLQNNYIEAANISEFYGQLGVPGSIGSPLSSPADKTAEVRSQIQTISGAMGVLVFLAGTDIGWGAIAGTYYGGAVNVPAGAYATFSAYAGALSGAAIGFAMVSFLLDYTGVGRGLPPALVYHLTAAGATAGAIIGISMAAGNAGLGTGVAAGSTSAFGAAAGAWAAAAVVAWVVIIVIIVIIVIFALLGIGKIRKEYYSFQCNPWQAPSGGDKCSQCGKDGYPCSKYSCQSLGQNCKLINEETQNPECVNVAPNDVSAPVIAINATYFPEGYRVEVLNSGARIITDQDNGCIPESYQILLAGLQVNEPAKCTMSSDRIEVEGEGENLEFISNGLYKSLHAVPIAVPPLSSLGLEDFDPSSQGDVTYHITCEDKSGNKNVNSYAIEFCVAPGTDNKAPSIITKDPFYETVRSDATQINASVFTSEPADCKWSLTDKEYSVMENEFTCANDFEERVGIMGWRCASTFNMDANEKTYYVRCMDQPWISEENATTVGRNANNQSYLLKFKRSTNPLKIDYINLDNKTFEYNTTPASVEIILKTSGGLDGTAKCGYVYGSKTIEFFETLSTEHRQVSPAYLPGEYALTFKCEDQIGSTAERTAYFEVKIDDSAPKITRAYSRLGTLYVVTDEKAKCYYVEDTEENCYFDTHGNSTEEMERPRDLLHSLEVKYGITYNIKCVDEYGHYPGECTQVIRGVSQ